MFNVIYAWCMAAKCDQYARRKLQSVLHIKMSDSVYLIFYVFPVGNEGHGNINHINYTSNQMPLWKFHLCKNYRFVLVLYSVPYIGSFLCV